MRLRNIALAGALSLAFGNAQATLFDRGGGLIYDDVLNVTWLQDANYAKTSGYDVDGLMNWTEANNWASNLLYAGYSDWRLPISNPTCMEMYVAISWCRSSEMGNLYQVTLGNISAYEPVNTGYGLKNVGPFQNWNEGHGYWSSTQDPGFANTAFYFHFAGGGQSTSGKENSHYAWAVRDGDVAAPIPEPETYAMMLAGLGLLGLTARRRRQKLNA